MIDIPAAVCDAGVAGIAVHLGGFRTSSGDTERQCRPLAPAAPRDPQPIHSPRRDVGPR